MGAASPPLLRFPRRTLARALPTLTILAAVIALLPARALAAPCPGAGECPYSSVSILGQRAEGVLRFPEAVALDPAGNVFVADQLSYVVQKFSAAGAFETEWGSYGGGHGQFGPIGGLASDAAGNVYVVDSAHDRIEKFDDNGNFLLAWGHRGSEAGQFDFGSSQNYTHPPGGGIAVAGGYVYVADSGNNRIERFNLQGGEPLVWGTHGSGPGEFSYPRGVAANASEVIVADDDNHRLEKFDPNGAYQGETGSQGAGPGQFAFPYGVALDAAGNVYVADDTNHRVVKLDPQLRFAGAWGGLGAKAGQLAFPRALAADPAGDTFVADTANDRLEVFDPSGNYLRTIGVSAHGRGLLTGPRGLAVDPTGRLLVSDTVGNRIELFTAAGYEGEWTTAGGARAAFTMPSGLAADPRGPVYVQDSANGRLVRLWGDGTFLSEIGGPAALGGVQLSGARAVAVAPGTGDVYAADTAHNRILLFASTGAPIARWGAGGGSGAAGSGPGEFSRPAGVAVNGSGDAYVADTGNNRVVELSPSGAVLAGWGGLGGGDGRFRGPAGVALDGVGDVYVLDGENNRVQVFDPHGRFLAKWGLRGAGLGFLSQPSAIAVGCDGAVYVADTNNNRVERFYPVSPAPTGCVSRATWPPPLDVAPVVRVSLARRGGVLARRALALAVSCERGCRVLARATLAPLGRRGGAIGGASLIAAARPLPAAAVGHLRLRVGAASLLRLRRALGGRGAMLARVRIVAVGPTGRRTTLLRRYLVRR